jgi:general secretion pathway protein D
LAITPKILSNVTLPEATFSEYWSGTDSVISDKPLLNSQPASLMPGRTQQMRELQLQRQRELNDGGNARGDDASGSDTLEPAPADNASTTNESTAIPPPDSTPAKSGASVTPGTPPAGMTNNISDMPEQGTTSLPAPKEIP